MQIYYRSLHGSIFSEAMAHYSSPLLLTVAALLPATAITASILALIFSFKTDSDDEYYYLSGIQGSLFLLLTSLSVLASYIIQKPLNNLLLLHQAWLVARHTDSLRPSNTSTSLNGIKDGDEGVFAQCDLIALLNGKPELFKRALKTSNRNDDCIPFTSIVFATLFWLLLGFLFALTLVDDIWLHITSQIDNINSGQEFSTSRTSSDPGDALRSSCTELAPWPGGWQVTLGNNFCQNRFDIAQNDTEAAATLSGTSLSNRILLVPHDFKETDIAVLADATSVTVGAYAANCYGVSTTCQPLSEGCNFDNTSGKYNCTSPPFAGYATQQLAFSTPSLSNGETFFSVAAILSGTDGLFNDRLTTTASAISSRRDKIFIALNCSSQVLEVKHTARTGSPRTQTVKQSDDQTQWLILAPVFPGQVSGYDSFGSSQMISATVDAVIDDSVSNPQDLANAFATAFSQAAIASSAGILVPAASGQSTSGSAVSGSTTLLPKAPIVMIIALNFVYIALSGILGTSAAILSHRDKCVNQIQPLLTYKGAFYAALKQHQGRANGTSSRSRAESTGSTEKADSRRINRPQAENFSQPDATDMLASAHASHHVRLKSEHIAGQAKDYV